LVVEVWKGLKEELEEMGALVLVESHGVVPVGGSEEGIVVCEEVDVGVSVWVASAVEGWWVGVEGGHCSSAWFNDVEFEFEFEEIEIKEGGGRKYIHAFGLQSVFNFIVAIDTVLHCSSYC
jgi:hypothetical protein